MIDKLKAIVGDSHVLGQQDSARLCRDFTGEFNWTPSCRCPAREHQ